MLDNSDTIQRGFTAIPPRFHRVPTAFPRKDPRGSRDGAWEDFAVKIKTTLAMDLPWISTQINFGRARRTTDSVFSTGGTKEMKRFCVKLWHREPAPTLRHDRDLRTWILIQLKFKSDQNPDQIKEHKCNCFMLQKKQHLILIEQLKLDREVVFVI